MGLFAYHPVRSVIKKADETPQRLNSREDHCQFLIRRDGHRDAIIPLRETSCMCYPPFRVSLDPPFRVFLVFLVQEFDEDLIFQNSTLKAAQYQSLSIKSAILNETDKITPKTLPSPTRIRFRAFARDPEMSRL